MVRFPDLPRSASESRRREPAACHHRETPRPRARARDSSHRQRQVALLSAPGADALRGNRGAHRGDFSVGGVDGRPGCGDASPGHRLRHHDQRPHFHAGTRRGACPHPSRRRRYRAGRSGAISQSFVQEGDRGAPHRRVGRGRGALPVEMGTRLPPRLSLRRALHRRAPRRGFRAHPLPDRHRQARCRRRYRRAFRVDAAVSARSRRRWSGAHQSRIRGDADFGFATHRAHPLGTRRRT